jgi:uncharacterized protein YraI
MIKSTKRAAAVTALAAAAIMAASAGAASAATTGHDGAAVPNTYGTFTNHVTTNGVNIRSGPGTGYTSLGQAQASQSLTDYCYKVGTPVGGNVYWDHIKDNATGVTGYISEYYLVDKSQTKPC